VSEEPESPEGRDQPVEPPPPGGAEVDDQPVPRLPRGRGWKLSTGDLMRIAMFATLLVAVLVLRKPCAENVGNFVQSFSPPTDAAPPPRTGPEIGPLPPGTYVHVTGQETEEELRAKIEAAEKQAGGGEVAKDAGVEGDAGTAGTGQR